MPACLSTLLYIPAVFSYINYSVVLSISPSANLLIQFLIQLMTIQISKSAYHLLLKESNSKTIAALTSGLKKFVSQSKCDGISKNYLSHGKSWHIKTDSAHISSNKCKNYMLKIYS